MTNAATSPRNHSVDISGTVERRIVLSQIDDEREKQDAKWGESNWEDGTGEAWSEAAEAAKKRCDEGDATGTTTWAMILEEECLEVLCETDPVRLREELVQVAAAAVAWIECLDRRAN